MDVNVSSSITITNPPKLLKEALISELTLINPKFTTAERLGYSTFRIEKYLRNFKILPNSSLRIPRGMRNKLIMLSESMGIEPNITNDLTYNDSPHNILSVNSTDLRKYQRKYLYNTLISGIQEGIIVSPAGSGKTIVGAALISCIGQSTLWLTHRSMLMKQTRKRLLDKIDRLRPEDIGIIQSTKWDINPIITIASVDSMRGHTKEIRKLSKIFGLVILDEAHHCPAFTFSKIIAELKPYYLIGLTATPYRADGLEPLMYQCLGDQIVNIPPKEVEADGGILMPTVVYKIVEHTKMEGNNIGQILKYLSSNEKRNNIIVRDVIEEAVKGKRSVVISTRKEHCEELFKLLSIGWQKIGIVTGDYSEKHNDEQLQKLLSGEITVVVASLEKFGEGVDVDVLENAFLALPIRSEQDVEQLVGRLQRVEKNKKEAKLFDYIDKNIGVLMDQFSTPTKNKECRLKAYKRLDLIIKPAEG